MKILIEKINDSKMEISCVNEIGDGFIVGQIELYKYSDTIRQRIIENFADTMENSTDIFKSA